MAPPEPTDKEYKIIEELVEKHKGVDLGLVNYISAVLMENNVYRNTETVLALRFIADMAESEIEPWVDVHFRN